MNLSTSVNQITSQRQASTRSQNIFKSEQKVYLYGDISYTGKLKKKTFPLIRREEVLRRRKMGLPKCC